MSSSNVREENLTYKDNSTFHGQVLGQPAQPHGYGRLQTTEGFVMVNLQALCFVLTWRCAPDWLFRQWQGTRARSVQIS
jgi:hypothetical protein